MEAPKMKSDAPLSSKENLSVSIRIKPASDTVQKRWQLDKEQNDVICGFDAAGEPIRGQMYKFDNVFTEDTTTKAIFDTVAKRIIGSVVEGFNGTIFAYGQTAAGKTYTMQGTKREPGLVRLAAREIFSRISKTPERSFLIRVSYLEIYNEEIRDLLDDSCKKIHIREHPTRGIFVESNEVSITSLDMIQRCLEEGEARRHIGETDMNKRSSRSHTIFRITIESRSSQELEKEFEEGKTEEESGYSALVATLNLVDLAGSESVRVTNAKGDRLVEAGNINKSLLSLSQVIKDLSTGQTTSSFRNSKLTRLLQPSLAGNTRTAIICCVTPVSKYFEETKSTLKFASNAKNITLSIAKNEIMDDKARLNRLHEQLQSLKRDKERLETDMEHRVGDKVAQVLEEEREKIKRQYETIIHEMRASLLVGGRVVEMRRSVEDGESASSVAHSLAHARLKRGKRGRSRKMRQTWCPGEMADPKQLLEEEETSFDFDAPGPAMSVGLPAVAEASATPSSSASGSGSSRASTDSFVSATSRNGRASRLKLEASAVMESDSGPLDFEEEAPTMEEAKGEEGELQATIRVLEEENLKLREALEAAAAPAKDSDESQLSKEVEELKQMLAEAVDEAERAHARALSAEAKMEELINENSGMQGHIEAVEKITEEVKHSHAQAINDHEAQLADLKQQLQAAEYAKEQAMAAASSTSAAVSEDLAALRAKVAQLEKEVAEKTEAVQAAEVAKEQAMATASSTSAAVSENLAALEAKVAQLEKEVAEKTEVAQAAEEAKATAEGSASNLSAELEALRKITEEVKHSHVQAINDHEAQLADLKRQLQAAEYAKEQAMATASSTSAAVSEDLAALEAKVAQLEQEVAEKTEAVQAAEEARATAQDRAETAEMRVSQLQSELSSTSGSESLQEEIDQLRQMLNEAVEEAEQSSLQARESDERLAEAESAVSSLTVDKAELVRRLEKASEQSKQELRDLEAQRLGLQEENERLTAALQAAEDKAEHLTAKTKELAAALENLESQHADLTSENKELQAQVKRLQEEAEAAAAEVHGANGQITSLTAQLTAAEQTATASESRIADLQRRVEAAEAAAEEAKRHLAAAGGGHEANGAYQQEAAALKAELAGKLEQIQYLQKRVERLDKVKLTKEHARMWEKQLSENRTLKENLKQAIGQNQRLREEVRSLKESRADLRTQLLTAGKSSPSSDAQVTALKADLAQRTQELLDTSMELEESQAKVRELTKDLKSREALCESLKGRMEDISAQQSKATHDKLQDRLAKLLSVPVTNEEDTLNAVMELQCRCQSFEVEELELKKELTLVREKYEAMVGESSEAKQRVAQLEAHLHSLQSSNDKQKAHLNELEAAYKEAMNGERAASEEVKAMAEELRRAQVQHEEEVQEFRSRIHMLERENLELLEKAKGQRYSTAAPTRGPSATPTAATASSGKAASKGLDLGNLLPDPFASPAVAHSSSKAAKAKRTPLEAMNPNQATPATSAKHETEKTAPPSQSSAGKVAAIDFSREDEARPECSQQ